MIIINKNTGKIYYYIDSNHGLTLDEALDFVGPETWREEVDEYGCFHDRDEDIYYDDLNITSFTYDAPYAVRDRETGTILESNLSLEQAKELIELYEATDSAEGLYEEDYYEIYDSVKQIIVEY